jgi:hypothetical protein
LDVVRGSAEVAFRTLALDDGVALFLGKHNAPGQIGIKFALVKHVCGYRLTVGSLSLYPREGETQFNRVARRTRRMVIPSFLELSGRDASICDNRIENVARAFISHSLDALKEFRGYRFPLSH